MEKREKILYFGLFVQKKFLLPQMKVEKEKIRQYTQKHVNRKQ